MAGYYSGKKLYRSRDGVLLGVCKGIAEWRDFPVDIVRLAFILLVWMGGLPIWIYFILAFVLPLEPEFGEDGSRYRKRKKSAEDVHADFENLKKRVNRMEDEELDKERDWDNRFSKDR